MKIGAVVVTITYSEGEQQLEVRKAKFFVYRTMSEYFSKSAGILSKRGGLNVKCCGVMAVLEDAHNIASTKYYTEIGSIEFIEEAKAQVNKEWFRWIQTLC